MDLLLKENIGVFLFTVQTDVTKIIEMETNRFSLSFKQIIQLFLIVPF